MARPNKEYKIQRNGDSVQVFERGEYVGSLPIRQLCEMIRAQKDLEAVYTQATKTHNEGL